MLQHGALVFFAGVIAGGVAALLLIGSPKKVTFFPVCSLVFAGESFVTDGVSEKLRAGTPEDSV